MVKDPRPHKPGSSEPDEALDLLRALARSRAPHPSRPEADPPPAHSEDDKLDSLRALAERLDFQLRASPSDVPRPPPSDAPWSPPPETSRPPLRRASYPPRDRWQTLRAEWRALIAALPEAAALVPRFTRAHIIYIGVAVAVLVLAAVGGLVGSRKPSPTVPATTPTSNQAVTPPVQVVPPVDQAAPTAPPTDIPAITKAMSDCDAAAAHEPDSLYFLILPLVPTIPGDHDWRAVALQTVGNAFLLLSAKDALDGLRDKTLAVRPGRYTFSVLDSGTGASYSWTSATAMSRLARKDSGTVKTLKLGFDFTAAQAGAQWTAEFKRDPGACYWVSVLVRE